MALAGGPIDPLAEAMERERPSTSLLVPALLAQWVAWLEARDAVAPDSLRFVAVGGAATAPALIDRGRGPGAAGLRGLRSRECCSVVAMNRPGDAVRGTVGRVLDGLSVTIEDGEIVVEGPTVMEAYLNGPPAPARWRTGDRGWLHDGLLVIEGRCDALLVLPTGRNVSPEWVEARVNADRRVIASVLCLGPDGRLLLLVAARTPIALAEIARLCADLPAYARPAAVARVEPRGLFLPSGSPDRAAARRLAATVPTEALPEPEPVAS